MELKYLYNTDNIHKLDIQKLDISNFIVHLFNLRNKFTMDNILYEYATNERYIECCYILHDFRQKITNHSQARTIIKDILNFCLQHKTVIFKPISGTSNLFYYLIGCIVGYYLIAFGKDANQQYTNITAKTINKLYTLQSISCTGTKTMFSCIISMIVRLDKEMTYTYNVNINDLNIIYQYYLKLCNYKNIQLDKIILPYKYFNIDMSHIYALLAKLLYTQGENEPELYKKNLIVLDELIPTHKEKILSQSMIYELGSILNAFESINI